MSSFILLLTITLLWVVAVSGVVDIKAVRITSVSPRYGSLNGAVRLTIKGKGFSEDQFNFGNGRSNLGNKVRLVSATRSFECDPHKDGNTKTQITCNTRAMPQDDYMVRVSVDGKKVPQDNHCGSCKFIPNSSRTPSIQSLEKRSGFPREVQQINGKIITTRYGSNSIISSNGREEKILRAYAGGQLCDFKKEDGVDLPNVPDELYGINLNSEKSLSGTMKCKMLGTYIGNSNFSYIIETLGRSMPEDDVFRVTAQDKITMFQTYADITNVTPSTGSEEGGTRLTITGRFFDQTDAPAKVTVGGTSCKVVSLKDTIIKCDTEPKPTSYVANTATYPGNRGVDGDFYLVDSSLKGDFVKVSTYNITGGNSTHLDEMEWDERNFDSSWNNYMMRTKAFFIPPRDGGYRFSIPKSDDDSHLFFSETGDANNLTEIAAKTRIKANERLKSDKFILKANKAYPLVHVTEEKSGYAYGQVGVHISETSLRGGLIASSLKSEKQTVTTGSVVFNEVQTVQLDGWSSQIKRSEVQRVTIISDNVAEVSFRLGMGGVWTAPLTISDVTTMQKELNSLPSITPDTVTVSANVISGGTNLDVTFNSDLGDVDMLTAMVDEDANRANVTLDVQEMTEGLASMEKFALTFMGAATAPISKTASASEVEAAVTTLFQVRCPSFLKSPRTRVGFNLDFESAVKYWESGTRVTDVEPLCGDTCMMNPSWLYREHSDTKKNANINLLSTGKVCFAYKGTFQQKVYVNHHYTTSSRSTPAYRGDQFTVTIPRADGWRYVCLDVKLLLTTRHSGLTSSKLARFFVYRDLTTSAPIYVDNVLIVTDAPTTDLTGVAQLRRLPPPRWMLANVKVTGNSSAGYQINMTLRGCPYNLPLFSAVGAQVQSSMDNVNVMYNATTWTSGATIAVQRKSAATPPVEGTFSLTLGSRSAQDIDSQVTASDLKDTLESDLGGTLNVVRTGTCVGYQWKITWVSAPGDQLQLIMDGSALTGENVTYSVETEQDGGAYLVPISGDFLRTMHNTPQVTVDINKIPSICSGQCDFTWEASATPSVTSISPSTGSNMANTNVTITGTGFSTTVSENTVTIGGAVCSGQTASSTEIQCAVGKGPAGTQDVVVKVQQKGKARDTNGVLQFKYEFEIDSVEPVEGSLGGGTLLAINGTGFSSNISATVGGSACTLVSTSYSSIACLTPPGSAGAVSVEVTDGTSSAAASTQYTYKTSLTPIVTSLNQNTFQVNLGQTLSISGSSFGSSAGPKAVTVGGTAASVSSYTDTQIDVTLPLLAPGAYDLKVNVVGKGYADTSSNSIPQITYDLSVTNVFPTSGSQEGGTIVTVTGTGFPSDVTQVQVNIGGRPCDVTASASTQVLCTAPSAGTLHTITNMGVDPVHGDRYAWSRPTVWAVVGDTVRWTWEAPEGTTSMYKVQETISATNISRPEDGFTSGAKLAKGAYKYQFTTAGKFFYWSEFVDSSEKISMRGVIHVKVRNSSSTLVELKVNGKTAIYKTGSRVSDLTSGASCSPTNNLIGGCTEQSPSSAGEGFNYEYLACKTAELIVSTPEKGSIEDMITITGTGFSTTDCHNVVKIGDKSCTVASSSMTQITCKMVAGGNAVVGIPQRVTAMVNNIGLALNTQRSDLDRHFVLLPHIASVSPTTGSVKGGTEVVITGSGFYGEVMISMGSVRCIQKSMTYTRIVCITETAFNSNQTLTVKVLSNGQNVDALCQAASCNFEFSSQFTPTVSEVNPSTISTNDTQLVISGTQFGSDTNMVNVTLGGVPCMINFLNDTAIGCVAEDPVAGTHPVVVLASGKGLADATGVNVRVNAIISSVSPTSGSTEGGNTLSLKGLGFKAGLTSVKVGGKDCTDVTVNSKEVTCKVPAKSAGLAKILLLSNSISYPLADYTYSPSDTPVATSLSSMSGISGDTLTISGTGFSLLISEMKVEIGGVDCVVSAAAADKVSCTLGLHSAGRYVIVIIHAAKGRAECSLEFTYELDVTNVSPSAGSYGGNQLITLTGKGFDSSNTTVTICDQPCTVNGSVTPSQLTCLTPAKASAGAITECDIKVVVANLVKTLLGAFNYSLALTPTISDVSPRRAGTGGNTILTITGTGFDTDPSQVSVDLGGTDCPLVSVTDTKVVCTTQSRKPSIKTKVKVSIADNGIATQDAADFEYIDVWSSQFTWNYSMPESGDFVVIPSDMTVLLDTDTPILKILLIDGGTLIFDEKDVELQAENILITNGGTLQIGTEASPHQSKATITLHGYPRSKELPIYGAKTLAVREGVLDMHGVAPNPVWTVLGATANAGDNQITLNVAVDWKVGDSIAIGSTGDKLSQAQHEMRSITAVSNGGKTLTLDSTLTFKHMGETVDLGSGYSLEARAPVGILTRNVLVRGSNNAQWADTIESCPDGFDPGEFATQTCFEGRFGEETGSDQFGVQIMIHAPRPNENLVTGRIEHIEVTYAGQAFRLGRYAIHFHLNGDMSGHYVRGCAIHYSFNRAINIHGTHNILIQNNIVYNIMGGAIFLEDGIEIGNVFDGNLAIFVKGSSSLQNDDITPAAFWLTNPNNTVINNVASGGTHFGFWYRLHSHPDGPSFDPNYCPQHIPLGTFRNNTVLSHGWFGIWIFMEYYPMEGGGCKDNNPIAAKYYSLTAWNNEKGAEWVGGSAIQFHDFFLVNNILAGIEMKLISHSVSYSEERGAMLKNCVIVARPEADGKLVESTTKNAVITPYARGLLIQDMTYVNFNGADSVVFGVTSIQGTSMANNGGFTYRTSGQAFKNSPNKIGWRWIHEGIYHDLDGTLTGTAGAKAVPTSGILPNDKCTHNVAGMSVNAKVPGSVCLPDVEFSRFSYNLAAPSSLVSKNVSFTNGDGTTITQWMSKRITHKMGWMVILPVNQAYMMEFENAGHLTNITYTGTMYDLKSDQYVIVKHNLTQRPDHFQITNGRPAAGGSSMVTYAANKNGDWYFDEPSTTVSYLISGKSIGSGRKKRAAISPPEAGYVDRHLTFRAYRCYYLDCIPPVDPNTLPPPKGRPADFVYWSNVSAWTNAEPGWGGNNGDGTFSLPKDGDNVKILQGVYVVADIPLPTMSKLYIHGVLELDYMPDKDGLVRDFTLSATHIFINGGRLQVGWEDDRYTGTAKIVLRGDHLTPDIPLPSGSNMGSKVIGVFGNLELHGMERDVTWTRLSVSAVSGSDTIKLAEPVDWRKDEEIVIASTGFSAWETETMKITGVSSDNRTLTLNSTLKHTHKVTTQSVGGGKTVTFAAEVGLLTRNIQIIGDDNGKLLSQAFGARVLVGKYTNSGKDYTERVYDIDGHFGSTEADVLTEVHRFQGRYIHQGNARISNVEFYRSGQDGWPDEYDPRFSVAFLDVGVVDDVKPSYLRKCSFHHGFAPSIGTFGVSKLNVTDNVIYHTVGSSIQDSGIDNAFRHNLVTLMVFPGTFNGRDEGQQDWDAGFDLRRATRPIITGNAVAGSERAGYRVDGEPCDDSTEPWADNTAHSVLIGVEMLPEDGLPTCSRLGNFTVYKAWDMGIYFQVTSAEGVTVSGLTLADCSLGIFPMVLGPSARSHRYTAKYVKITDSTIIGKTSGFDCTHDKMTNSDRNIFWSGNSRSWRSASGGHVGVAVATFSSGSNAAPNKPFINIMAYPAIGGRTFILDTTFVGFQSRCSSKKDVVLTTSPSNEDTQHPVRLQRITLVDVDNDNKVYIHRPNIGKINPSDCVDMACDGMKKIIIEDVDGTFLQSSRSTLIPQSEWQWGGDRRFGLGDYRIPKTLQTDTQGNRINVQTQWPNKGIIRDDTCVLKPAYNAWQCTGLDYELFTLESLDADTETRRLSPIAIAAEGYIDLINGPQDHGWCLGYTCQERLSTFPIVVATGKSYLLHYTGTSPQSTRLRLNNAASSEAVVLGIFYAIPQRLDVYVNNLYVMPTNAALDASGQIITMAPTYTGQYMPNVTTDEEGANYFDGAESTLHVLVRGQTFVDIVTSPLIVIGFDLPAMTVNEFFGANMVFNLATFLGISASNIKIAKAVPETRNRRKRSISIFKVELEISNPPGGNSSISNATDTDALSYDQLQNMTSAVINGIQLGTLGSVLNVTILDVAITEPVPAPSSSAWKIVVATTSTGSTYNLKVQIPKTMEVQAEPVGLTEGNILSMHPVLKVLDKNGDVVSQLGAKTRPWQVMAKLVKVTGSDSHASLTGKTTVEFLLGYANFTSLIVDYSGKYRLDYSISFPAEAGVSFTARSAEFEVAERTLALSMVSQVNETTVNENFTAILVIIDALTSVKVNNIAWKNHTWTCTASLYMNDPHAGKLSGSLSIPVNPETGMAVLHDLRLTSQGRYFIRFRVVSVPAQYDIDIVSGFIDARPVGWVDPVVETTKMVKIRFNVNYQSTLSGGKDKYLEAAIQNKIYSTVSAVNISIGAVTFTQGSILSTFAMAGSTVHVTNAVDGLHTLVSTGQFSLLFFGKVLTADRVMWVDGAELAIPDLTVKRLTPGLIAAIIICCLVILMAIVVGFVLLKMKLASKKKIGTDPELRGHQPLVDGRLVEAQLRDNGKWQQDYYMTPWDQSSSEQQRQHNEGRQSADPDWYMSPADHEDHANFPTASTTSTLQLRPAMDFQEIKLDSSNTTKQVPISEQKFDDEEEVEEGMDTGHHSHASGVSGGSRPRSRPPNKPASVWDDTNKAGSDRF